ncbi:MAG TPA: HAD-IA family hydrolase, partial [Micavibrio sp.]
VAVASNGEHESLKRKLQKVALYDVMLPHIYNKDDCGGKPKPAPDLYLYAAQKINTQPADCIVIEDSPTGIAAGKAAGMYVIGYAGGKHRDHNYRNVLLQSGADIVVNTMTEASDIIHKLLKPAKVPAPAKNNLP